MGRLHPPLRRQRKLVELYIQDHLPADQLKVLQAAEASERELLTSLVGQMGARS